MKSKWNSNHRTRGVIDGCEQSPLPDPTSVATPAAIGVFPAPDRVGERVAASVPRAASKIQCWTPFPHGGHGGQFSPVEEPAAVAGDLTAFFRDLS